MLKCTFSFYILCFGLLSNFIFGQNQDYMVISEIAIAGNKKTKEYVILRELPFQKGDTLKKSIFHSSIEKGRKNLLNTSLFNFVTIEDTLVENDVYLNIEVTERWYTWPYPILEVADPNINTWWQTKDLRRLNWGTQILNRNFRGRREQVGFYFQLGYSKQFGIMYDVPFTKKHQNFGFGVYSSYAQNYEVVYNTDYNKRQFTRPSGKSKEQIYNAVYFKLRKELYNSHQLVIAFEDVKVEDSVPLLNENFLGNGKRQIDFFEIHYAFKNDHRDKKNYPLNGYFIRLDLEQIGVGITSKSLYTSGELELKKFVSINKKVFWAGSFKNKYSLQKQQPYYFQRSLGYDNFIRGYEYYVVDGQYYSLFKNNLKYKLIESEKKTLPFIKNESVSQIYYAIYVNIYGDVGYVGGEIGKNNILSNQWQYGYGIGIDFVTYYDKVVRFEYSFNRMNQHGFFIHFVQPI